MTTSSSAAGSKPWRFCSLTSRPGEQVDRLDLVQAAVLLALAARRANGVEDHGVRHLGSSVVADAAAATGLTSDYRGWAHCADNSPSKCLVERFGVGLRLSCRLPIDLRARPVRGQVAHRHRRRLRHRPLHRARAGVARRARSRSSAASSTSSHAVHAEIEADGGACSHRTPATSATRTRCRTTVAAIVLARHGRIDGAGQQRRRPVPVAAGDDQRQGLGRGRAQQPHRRLPDGARVRHLQWMARRSGGAIVNIIADMWGGMPGMGHSGAARAGMVSFTETAALEWAQAGARQRGRAGLDRLQRHGPLSARDARPMLRGMQALVPLRRFGTESRGLGGDRVPALAGGRVHHAARACASTARAPNAQAASGPRSAPAATHRSRSTASISRRTPQGAARRLTVPALDAPPRHAQRCRSRANRAPHARADRAAGARSKRARARRARKAAPLFDKRGQLLPRERVARCSIRARRSSSCRTLAGWLQDSDGPGALGARRRHRSPASASSRGVRVHGRRRRRRHRRRRDPADGPREDPARAGRSRCENRLPFVHLVESGRRQPAEVPGRAVRPRRRAASATWRACRPPACR